MKKYLVAYGMGEGLNNPTVLVRANNEEGAKEEARRLKEHNGWTIRITAVKEVNY